MQPVSSIGNDKQEGALLEGPLIDCLLARGCEQAGRAKFGAVGIRRHPEPLT
jgi:hypothetical protein